MRRDDYNSTVTVRALANIGVCCVRHLVATMVTVAAACIVWTVVYFVLLLWAVLAGSGIGGPLAYPAGLIFTFVVTTLSIIAVLLPCTAASEWIGRRCALPVLVQIPISAGILALICPFWVGVAEFFLHGDFSFRRFLIGSCAVFVAHLVPLGFYWWLVQSGPLIASAFQAVRRWMRLGT